MFYRRNDFFIKYTLPYVYSVLLHSVNSRFTLSKYFVTPLHCPTFARYCFIPLTLGLLYRNTLLFHFIVLHLFGIAPFRYSRFAPFKVSTFFHLLLSCNPFPSIPLTLCLIYPNTLLVHCPTFTRYCSIPLL